MDRIIFLGKILPIAVRVNISGIPRISWFDSSTGQTAHFDIAAEASDLVVVCELDSFTEANLVPLYMRAVDLTRAVVDLMAFAEGAGLTVYLDRWRGPDGSEALLKLEHPDLRTLSTALDGPTGFHEVLHNVITEPPLFLALNDLISAITYAHSAPVNCARAIEGLRHLMAPGDQSRPSGWEAMRAALNIDREYLELITRTSVGPRHGDRSFIDGDVTEEVVKRSWAVMNRFLEYRKRRNTALPPDEFPQLTAED